jgi:predicted transcriptional regulator
MTPKVTDEIRQALQHSNGPIRIEDEQTHQVYVVVDNDTHERAMQALRKQEDIDAIQAGIDAMEAGRTIPLAEADERIRQELGFGSREQ